MARANLGEPWQLPTRSQFNELINNCTSVWTTRNGVYGRLFTSNINGNSIFLPAVGIFDGTNIEGAAVDGAYWSSTFGSDTEANRLIIIESNAEAGYNSKRYYGFSVRAVQ